MLSNYCSVFFLLQHEGLLLVEGIVWNNPKAGFKTVEWIFLIDRQPKGVLGANSEDEFLPSFFLIICDVISFLHFP